MLENRQKTGRDTNLPAAGIAAWHIDELGDKNNQSMVPNSSNLNYELTLVQADNQWHFQNNVNSGDAFDLYYQGNSAAAYTDRLDDSSTPHAHWWAGTTSGMNLNGFSVAGMSMTFKIGSGGFWTYSNSIGARNSIKITDMSGSLSPSGASITVAAWDVNGTAIPESTTAAALTLYSHGTTTISGATLAARFPTGTPILYALSAASSKYIITNVKSSTDGTLNVPNGATSGTTKFVANSVGARNSIKITDMSGSLSTSGAAITVAAWDVNGISIPEATTATPLMLNNHGTTTIAGTDLMARFPTGTPMSYEFTVGSSKYVITNVKNSTDGNINIPYAYASGTTNFVANSIGPRNTIKITDVSGSLSTSGAAITIKAWDVNGNAIPESTSAAYRSAVTPTGIFFLPLDPVAVKDPKATTVALSLDERHLKSAIVPSAGTPTMAGATAVPRKIDASDITTVSPVQPRLPAATETPRLAEQPFKSAIVHSADTPTVDGATAVSMQALNFMTQSAKSPVQPQFPIAAETPRLAEDFLGKANLPNSDSTASNLTPYKPTAWSDKIVVSKATGTNTDSSPLYTTDTLYVDFAVLNNGTAATAVRFYVELYVDNVLKGTWYKDPPLNVNYYTTAQDYSLGTLAAGTHTIRIKTDSTGVITEGNESDNEYTKTITITVPPTQPNLTPYKPSGWFDKIVVSKATGTNTDSSPLYTTDTLYVDWAVLNNGTGTTAVRFYTELYVDGVLKATWYTDPPMNVNYYTAVQDYSLGTLAAGTHTIRIKTDSTGVITESNESDNEYTKTITVTATSASLKLYSRGTTSITGTNLAARFPSGIPMSYEFTVGSSKYIITNVKSSTDGSINIPSVYTSGTTMYASNDISSRSTIKITDASGSLSSSGAAIAVAAWDVNGISISESGSAIPLKLYSYATTTISGTDLMARFPTGTPVLYEFTIGSSQYIVTNLTGNTAGTINIPSVYSSGVAGGI